MLLGICSGRAWAWNISSTLNWPLGVFGFSLLCRRVQRRREVLAEGWPQKKLRRWRCRLIDALSLSFPRPPPKARQLLLLLGPNSPGLAWPATSYLQCKATAESLEEVLEGRKRCWNSNQLRSWGENGRNSLRTPQWHARGRC